MKTEDAINYFDNESALAEILGVSTSAVRQWGEIVPSRRAYEIHDLTNGELRYEGRFTHSDKELAKKYHDMAIQKAKWKSEGLA